MAPSAYKQEVLQFKDQLLNKIKAYEQSGEIDKKTSELLKNDIILKTYQYLFNYYSLNKIQRLKRKNNNIDDKVPNNYYDFIKDMPLKKQSLLVSNEFSSFISALNYAAPLQSKDYRRINIAPSSINDFPEFLKSKKVKLSTEDKNLFELASKEIDEKKTISKELQPKLSAFYKKYESFNKAFSTFLTNKSHIQEKNDFKKVWKERDSLATSLGIKNNLIYEIIKSRALKSMMISNLLDDKAWYWSELKKGIKSPHLITLGNNFIEQETSKPKFYELPGNEKGITIFKKIIAPYKNKIVVAQFSLASLERKKESHNKYKNNENIVFLFFSHSTSEKHNEIVEKYGVKNSITISKDDYNYMIQLFQLGGSPRSLLIGKDGTLISNSLEVYNMESIFKEQFNIEPDN